MRALRASLEALGSGLVVLTGPSCEELPKLAASLEAGRVLTEEEVEYR